MATLLLTVWGCAGGDLECGPGTKQVGDECVAFDGSTGDDDDDNGGGGGGGGGGEDSPLSAQPASVALEAAVPCEAIKTVTITNDGPGVAQVDLVYFEPDAAGLTLDPPPELPRTLQEGDSFDVVVKGVAEEPIEGQVTLVVASQRETLLEVPVSVDMHLEHVVEEFEGGTPMVDVMLLVDHSCSMEAVQTTQMTTAVPDLLAALDDVGDWQLLEVTLESGCGNGGVHDGTEANLATYLVNHAWDKDPGYAYGTPYVTESLLGLAALALDQTDAGECNEGFLRPGASLQLLIVSDEPEQSGVVWSTWLAYYQTIDPNVVVSGAVDAANLCLAGGAGGYEETIDATGGVALSICGGNWGANFGSVTDPMVGGSSSYELGSTPDPDSIVVTVDGDAAGFEYDAPSNTIVLDEDPPDGALVEVSYDAESASCG